MVYASIVLYNTREEDLIKVLGCAEKSIIHKIYVIDNSEKDTLRGLVKKLSSKTEYIYGQGNIGYGSAHNIAIRKAIEEGVSYHVVLNPDISFEADVMRKLESFMNNNPDIGQVLPKVFYPNGEFQYLCKLLPTPADIFLRQFAPDNIKEKNNILYTLGNADYSKVMDIPSLSGCFMFFRTDSLKIIGGFDERFFMHFEDIDITRRIGRIARTVYYPGASIVHAHEAAHKKNKKMLMIGLQSAVKYFNKWGWFFDSERRRKNKEVRIQYLNIR
jgi:GT2 family glycosyltransferase